MPRKILISCLYGLVLLLCVATLAGISVFLETKEIVLSTPESNQVSEVANSPFPVSVDPKAKTIAKGDSLQNYSAETLAAVTKQPRTWRDKVFALVSKREWYQNLASPVSRVIVIWPGERKEEIVKSVGDILRWNGESRSQFLTLLTEAEPALDEGKFYPGKYVAHKGATPEEVSKMISDKFNADILDRYTPEVAAKVPLEDALTIASLLEREASDFENMREVSGVIWNRLFTDMPLQLDATLQYAKAGNGSQNWWPVPKPDDKYLRSPYNTYANKGLPPGPIANPSAAAVIAALNPYQTDCLYYFHDDDRNYHCSATYEEHVTKLKKVFGRGR